MILVDKQIKDYIEKDIIYINPFDEKYINPNSLDVRLSDDFVVYEKCSAIDPYFQPKTKQVISNVILLNPQQFILARTKEYIKIPSNIVCELMGKSSLARLGLTVHQTGGFIDAGFEGTITLEIVNVNRNPIVLRNNMPIGQLVFFKTEHAEIPYGKKKNSKYQGQTETTPSRYHLNEVEDNE